MAETGVDETANVNTRRVGDLTAAELRELVATAVKAELWKHFQFVAAAVTNEFEEHRVLLGAPVRRRPFGLERFDWASTAAHLEATVREWMREANATVAASDVAKAIDSYSDDYLNDLLRGDFSTDELLVLRATVHRRLRRGDVLDGHSAETPIFTSGELTAYTAAFGAEFARALAHHRCHLLDVEVDGVCVTQGVDAAMLPGCVRMAEQDALDVASRAVEAFRSRGRDEDPGSQDDKNPMKRRANGVDFGEPASTVPGDWPALHMRSARLGPKERRPALLQRRFERDDG